MFQDWHCYIANHVSMSKTATDITELILRLHCPFWERCRRRLTGSEAFFILGDSYGRIY